MIFRVLLIAAALLGGPAVAETAIAGATGANEAPSQRGQADHQALGKLLADVTKGLSGLDSDILGKHLAPGFVLVLPDQTVITELTQLDRYFVEKFTGKDAPLKAVAFAPEAAAPTLFIDSRTGVVHGTSRDTYTLANDSQLTLDTQWTATVVKEGDRWLVQSFHAGVNLLDNPILRGARGISYLWAGIALFVGLVLGALLFRLFTRN